MKIVESIYNFYIKKNVGYTLYNTFYNGIVNITDNEYIAIKNSQFSKLKSQDCEFLVDNGFLINKDIDEKKSYYKLIEYIQKQDNVNYNYTIAVTTDCNARCSYCYEKGAKILKMDISCAKSVLKFIKSHYNNKKIYITWFGGEPLLNIEVISYICKKLKMDNIKFSSSVITNGYLFNDSKVEIAKFDWNLDFVQITIDGLFEEYNRIKLYKTTVENSFEIVASNIKRLIDKEINVAIRINVDKNNMKNVIKTFEFFNNKFPFCKFLHLYPAPIRGIKKEFQLDDDDMILLLEKIINVCSFYDLLDYRERLKKLPKLTACMKDDNKSFVIDADGSLCRCEQLIGKSKNGNCTIKNLLRIPDCEFIFEKKCSECVFMPKCLGGCYEEMANGDLHCCLDRYIIEAVLKVDI